MGAKNVIFFVILSLVCIAGLSQDSIALKGPAEKLSTYRFFFKGEDHAFPKENGNSLFTLLTYLYKNDHVRYLVMEFGPDFAFLANQYLETGDDSLLIERRLYFFKEFWKNLYEFNRSKDSLERIKVIGFDFNRFTFTAKVFDQILKRKNLFPHEELRSAFAKIIGWKDTDWDFDKQRQFDKGFGQFRSLCKTYEQELEDWLGIDYDIFYAIINNNTAVSEKVKRDKTVVTGLKKYIHEAGDENYLFNYGIEHIFLDGIGLAYLLANSEEFKGKVCSIYPRYPLKIKQESEPLTAFDKFFPAELRNELDSYPGNSLVSLEKVGAYPGKFKKAQWVLIIPAIE